MCIFTISLIYFSRYIVNPPRDIFCILLEIVQWIIERFYRLNKYIDVLYLLGFFVRRGFRAFRIRWVQARLALIAVRYSGSLHEVLERFKGEDELQLLHLVQHC